MEEGNMQCTQALKLSVTALLAFAGIAATDANDPTLTKIDSGTVRGTMAGGVVAWRIIRGRHVSWPASGSAEARGARENVITMATATKNNGKGDKNPSCKVPHPCL
jgi:hypothetical protein